MLTGTVLDANTNISHLSTLLQPQDIFTTILFIAHECNEQTCMVRNLRPYNIYNIITLLLLCCTLAKAPL